jgi:hypothetical protein
MVNRFTNQKEIFYTQLKRTRKKAPSTGERAVHERYALLLPNAFFCSERIANDRSKRVAWYFSPRAGIA